MIWGNSVSPWPTKETRLDKAPTVYLEPVQTLHTLCSPMNINIITIIIVSTTSNTLFHLEDVIRSLKGSKCKYINHMLGAILVNFALSSRARNRKWPNIELLLLFPQKKTVTALIGRNHYHDQYIYLDYGSP